MVLDANQQAFQSASAFLESIGLGELFSTGPDGQPQGWLWNQVQSGIDDNEALIMAAQQTDVFRERFGVIVQQQKEASEGKPTYVMSPSEVLQYENTVKQTMSAAGLPAEFYDEPKDFHRLILSDMSPSEVGERINEAYDYVLAAPPEVRAKFQEFYGPGQGDAQLAAWALDPERTVRDITKATRTAYAAGMGERFDVQIDRDRATQIADLPMTEAGISEGLRQVSRISSLFNEGLGESATDMTQDDGLDSVFEGDSEATDAIQRRLMTRAASNRTSTGGALSSQGGVTGLGSS